MKTVYKKIIISALSLIIGLGTLVYSTGMIGAEENLSADNEALQLGKIATKNEDGTYTLDLEAYATGDVSVITKSLPLDIILVLDQSGSMNDRIKPNWLYTADNDLPAETGIEYFVKNSANTYEEVYFESKIVDYQGTHFINTYNWVTLSGKKIIRKFWEQGSNIRELDINPVNQFYVREDNPDGEVSPTKLKVLQDAASSFIDSIEKDGGDHRVAVVGFAAGTSESYINTELFIGSKKYNYNSTAINNQYANAYQSVNTETGLRNINASINSLSANKATRADLGMEMANEIVKNDPNQGDTERKKVVIMFTDGFPTSTSVFDEQVANDTISNSKELKDAGATVFTVGVVDTLDNTQDPSNPNTNDLNKYMHYVSSNFPAATSLTNSGEGNYQDNKFLFATDEETLNQIFQKINEEITTSKSTLDAKTQLVDYISDSFLLVENKGIEVVTQDYLGKDSNGQLQWGNEEVLADAHVEINEVEQKIAVSGFSYKENYVVDANPAKGKKLIVRLTIAVKDGFIGGDVVPTNKIDSGIYTGDGTPVKPFQVPTADIELKYDLTNKANSIYLGSTLAIPSEIIDENANEVGFQFKQGENNYTIDGINNAFVDITYEIKDGDKVIGTYTIPAGQTSGTWTKELDLTGIADDKEFSVEATVKSVNSNSQIEPKATVSINVFKPTISLSGEVIFLGEGVNLNDKVKVESWKASNTSASTPKGAVPTLTYIYKDTENNIKPVKTTAYEIAQVLNGTVDIKNGTTINGSLDIQVVEGQLDITKTIDKQSSMVTNNNTLQTFVFRVDRRDTENGDVVETFYQTIDFSANQNDISKTATITGLQKGYYTVTEDTTWSWKYSELADQRIDNYEANGTTAASTENSNLFIGDKLNDVNAPMYYGSIQGTTINKIDHSNPAKVSFFGEREASNILGDSANAINKFNSQTN